MVALLAQVATKLPPSLGASLVGDLSRRLNTPLAIEYATSDLVVLIRSISKSEPDAASALLIAAVEAAIRGQTDRVYHLEQFLGVPVDEIAMDGGNIGRRFAKLIHWVLGRAGPSRKYTTLLVPNIDQRPRYGVDALWLLSNALYRVALKGPEPSSASIVADLLRKRDDMLRRIALEALAARPEIAGDLEWVLLDPDKWDDANSTRYEFRRALGAYWPRASDAAKHAVLAYATQASEAREIAARTDPAAGYSPDDIVRHWRRRFVHAIRLNLPQDWLDEFGPVEPLDDDRAPQMTSEWVRDSSPIGTEELQALSPDELLSLISNPSASDVPGFEWRRHEALATAVGEIVVNQLPAYVSRGSSIAKLHRRSLHRSHLV